MDKSLALEVLDFWLSVFPSIYDYGWVFQRLNQKIIGGYYEIIVSLSRETYTQPLYDNEWYVKRVFWPIPVAKETYESELVQFVDEPSSMRKHDQWPLMR